VYLENLSKTNPGATMLNDNPLAEPRKLLSNGDIIQICSRKFLFRYGALGVAERRELGGRERQTGSARRRRRRRAAPIRAR